MTRSEYTGLINLIVSCCGGIFSWKEPLTIDCCGESIRLAYMSANRKTVRIARCGGGEVIAQCLPGNCYEQILDSLYGMSDERMKQEGKEILMLNALQRKTVRIHYDEDTDMNRELAEKLFNECVSDITTKFVNFRDGEWIAKAYDNLIGQFRKYVAG